MTNPLANVIDFGPAPQAFSIVNIPFYQLSAVQFSYSTNSLAWIFDYGRAPIVFSDANVAHYRVLTPHWIHNFYYDVGLILTETIDVPTNWVPTLAVDPLDTRAVNAFYAAGPRGIAYEDLNKLAVSQWVNVTPSQIVVPVTYWVKRGNQYFLTGLGANFPPIGGN